MKRLLLLLACLALVGCASQKPPAPSEPKPILGWVTKVEPRRIYVDRRPIQTRAWTLVHFWRHGIGTKATLSDVTTNSYVEVLAPQGTAVWIRIRGVVPP